MQRVAIIPLLILLLFLAACGLLNSNEPEETTAVASETPPTPTNTPVPVITPDIAIPTVLTSTTDSLTIWVPVELWMATESGQATLAAQIEAYRASHPDLVVKVEPKSVTGQGSILSYLRTGRTVAPDILPDLIALPTDQLATAYSEELIFGLDGFLPLSLYEDTFPAGLTLTQFEGQTIAYPIVLSRPPHLAFDAQVYTGTVPADWESFIALPEQKFVFPAAGTPGATLLLEMYLDAGGTLINEVGQPELQLEPLVTALQELSTALENGFILTNSSNIQTLEDSWQIFQTGNTTFVQTNAEQFLNRQQENEGVGVAAIPGLEEPLVPLVSGWGWAISTTDSAKRPLVAELITFLADTANLGEWSFQSQLLPARQGALRFWPEDNPYVPFASEMLLKAKAHPFPPNHPVMLALGNAVFDVVSLSTSPQVAAEEAIATLQE